MPVESLAAEEARALGEEFRRARLRTGLSQEKLANRAGISAHQYGLIESGLSDRKTRAPANPGSDTWRALIKVFSEELTGFHVDFRYRDRFTVEFHFDE